MGFLLLRCISSDVHWLVDQFDDQASISKSPVSHNPVHGPCQSPVIRPQRRFIHHSRET